MNFTFITDMATNKDYTPYLDRALNVGAELELSFRGNVNLSSGERTYMFPYAKEFGVNDSRDPECPPQRHDTCFVCGHIECWNHLPPHLIRDIGFDGGGREFRIYATNITSEEFVSMFPIEPLQKNFYATVDGGLHIHVMTQHGSLPLPKIILQNTYQLYRVYYLGYIHMFGNQPKNYIRSSYGKFGGIAVDALTNSSVYAGGRQGGIHFGRSQWNKDGTNVNHFDVEIRSADATTDLGQIVGARALAKAFVMRASQLANVGGIEVPNEHMQQVYKVYQDVGYAVEDDSKAFMKANARDLFMEMASLLTPFERKIIKNLIENPVRERTKNVVAPELLPLMTTNDDKIKKMIFLGDITSPTAEGWITQTNTRLKLKQSEIIQGLKKLNARFDRELGKFVI